MRASLEDTAVGRAARDGARQILSLLVYGRSPCGGKCYGDIPLEERMLPNGGSKISNPGLHHTNPTYKSLIAGSCEIVSGSSSTHLNTVGGHMAM